jgi:alanine racemase
MRPTWAEIDLDAVKHNFMLTKELVGERVAVLSVVKADAYGHGAVEVSKVLVESGTDMLGVATVEEAMELRDYGIEVPILLLGGIRPAEAGVAIENDLTPCLFSIEVAEALNKESEKAGKRAKYHLKIDTGMTRLGVRAEELDQFLSKLITLKNIDMEGAMTHLPSVHMDHDDDSHNQIHRFHKLVSSIKQAGLNPRYLHSSKSASIQSCPLSHMDLVRPGIMLYGSGNYSGLDLHPVMKLKSEIIQIRQVPEGTPVSYGRTFVTSRPSTIATLPIGYADGYMRSLSNKAFVSVNGHKAHVVGTVCMDLTMIDVTDIPDVGVGGQVVLFGDDLISVDDVAFWAQTISYELLSSIGKRVPRIYV